MTDQLAELLAKLRDDISLRTSVEEATRQAAVLPILRRLGWNDEDLSEVAPEFSVEDGRVDYCLKLSWKNAVFIEVKRTGESLDSHQKQLLNYAFVGGVEQAVLTDGLVWWFYLPLNQGSWEQRRFFTIDLKRQGPDAAASNFRRYLGRDAVSAGSAHSDAEAVLRDEKRADAVREAMPRAWEQLLSGPDELLADLLAEAVEGLSGYSPDDESVAQFLATVASGSTPVKQAPPPAPSGLSSAPPPAPPAVSSPPPSPTLLSSPYTGTKPDSYPLFGKEHSIKTWQAVLMGVYGEVYENHKEGFDRVLQLKGTYRPYFSKDPNALKEPKAILDSGIHAETNLNANQIVQRCEAVLKLFGYDRDQLSIRGN